jgi:arylsulfatase A-like enzyme
MQSRGRGRLRLGLGAGVLLAAGVVSGGACQRDAPRPDVVLIVIDTLRADHLELFGYARQTAPRLTAFANEGIHFERAYTAAPWTLPAMAALFTGIHPTALGVGDTPILLSPSVPSLPEALGELGYRTYGVVSNLFVARKFGFDRGFDHWHEEHAQGRSYVSSPGVTDEAIRFAEMAVRDEPPFFLFAHYFDPHYDYLEHADHRFSTGYTGALRSHNDNVVELREAAEGGAFDASDLEHLRDLYDSEVQFTDAHIGRLLDALARLGVYDDALIVITADHGEALAERPSRWIGHTRMLYDEVARVPLIFKLPGRSAPETIRAPVSLVDVFPTIMNLLGAAPRGATRATVSERSLIRNADRRPVFIETWRWRQLQAVVKGRWKLVFNRRTGRYALYDLEEDAAERKNLARTNRSVVRELASLLAAWNAVNAAELKTRKVVSPELGEEELRKLRELGYAQ